MVGMLTFHSDDPSSNPAEAHYFSEKFVFEKKENKQKEARVGPFFKKNNPKLRFLLHKISHNKMYFFKWQLCEVC